MVKIKITKKDKREYKLKKELKKVGIVRFIWKYIKLPFFVLGIIIKMEFFNRCPKEIDLDKQIVSWQERLNKNGSK